MEIYHDIWVRGQVIAKGRRPSAERYEAIRPILASYQRRFTLLDLGAGLGYFSFRAASEFNCVAVMVDDDDYVLPYCRENALSNVIFLHHQLSADDLRELTTCEHFDVVLALNVLHHFGDWEGAVEAVMNLGDNIIVETPAPDDTGACNYELVPALYERLESLKPERLGLFESHVSATMRPLWAYRGTRDILSRSLFHAPSGAWTDAHITSTIHEKSVYIPRKATEYSWHQGINLWTYKCLGGRYPSPETVVEMLHMFSLPTEHHGDIRPWNFIFDGATLTLIDGHDDRANFDDVEGLAETVRLML